jgi:hypothetical protein
LLNDLRENKIIKDDFSFFEFFFGENLQIYLFEHPWDEATYVVHQNG